MEFMEIIKSRYSVRSFSDRRVEDEKLDTILEAVKFAPTACNNQPQKLYVLKSAEAIKKLENSSKFVFGAKTAIIFTSDSNLEWKNPFSSEYHTGEIDCSIACTHAMLQAQALGIGSCWIGFFDPEKIRTAFCISENEKVIAILLLGYPAEDCKPAPGHYKFRSMDDMVKYL